MIGYSSHSAGCALTQSIPSAPAVCNHRSSYRQTHLKRYVGFTFSCRLPIDNIRFGQPETPMYLRPFLSHRTVPFRSTRSSRSSFHSVVADLGGKAENLLTDESFRSWYARLDSNQRPLESELSGRQAANRYAARVWLVLHKFTVIYEKSREALWHKASRLFRSSSQIVV